MSETRKHVKLYHRLSCLCIFANIREQDIEIRHCTNLAVFKEQRNFNIETYTHFCAHFHIMKIFIRNNKKKKKKRHTLGLISSVNH